MSRDGFKVRPLMSEALELGGVGRSFIAVAPTGYGKTIASPFLHDAAVKGGLRGLVHVSPLRALVSQVYDVLAGVHPRAGLQSMDAPRDVKSPYFLRVPVATTLDSFLSNLFRLPVAEAAKIWRGASLGHWYPGLSAILSSLVVFDEAHLSLDENVAPKVGGEAFQASLTALTRMGVPLGVTTATLRPSLLAGAAAALSESGAEPAVLLLEGHSPSFLRLLKSRLQEKGFSGEVREVPDRDYLDLVDGIKWHTSVNDTSIVDAVDEIAEYAKSKPVLVVANTVEEAVNLYLRLRDRHDLENMGLLHGRMTRDDRERALEAARRLGEGEPGVLVATQTVEVGVDVNAAVLYTAAAPIEQLVQRAGRLCRRGTVLEECREEGARIIILLGSKRGPYPEEAVESSAKTLMEALNRGRCVDWRLPGDSDRCIGYDYLLAAVDLRLPAQIGRSPFQQVLDILLSNDYTPMEILKEIDDKGACGIYGDLSPLPVYVEERGIIPVGTRQLVRLTEERLIEGKLSEGELVIKLVFLDRSSLEPLAEGTISIRKMRGELRCSSVYYSIQKALIDAKLKEAYNLVMPAVKATEGAYKKGLGLVVV